MRCLIRALHVIADTDPRSDHRFAVELVEALREHGIDGQVVALTTGHARPGLDVTIAATSESNFLRVRAVRSLMQGFDVTVAHGAVAGEVVAAAARRKHPFVYRETVDSRRWARRPERPAKAPDHVARARTVVALSEGARLDLIDAYGLAPTAVRAIPLGVRTDGFAPVSADERLAARAELGVPAGRFVALVIGDLVPQASVDVAVRAVIPTEGVHLLVVGDGPERVRLESLAAGLAQGKVTFTGRLEDARRAYAAADVGVWPATSGVSMWRSLIESALCGLPAIATPMGSVPEVVIDGHTGVIVEPGSVEELTNAIER